MGPWTRRMATDLRAHDEQAPLLNQLGALDRRRIQEAAAAAELRRFAEQEARARRGGPC